MTHSLTNAFVIGWLDRLFFRTVSGIGDAFFDSVFNNETQKVVSMTICWIRALSYSMKDYLTIT